MEPVGNNEESPQTLDFAQFCTDQDSLLSALCVFTTKITGGGFPAELSHTIIAAMLPIPKKWSGLRPIAVGETLRRLAGKCLLLMEEGEALSYLHPTQAGVGERSGGEPRACSRSFGVGEGIVQIDSHNASLQSPSTL